MREVQNKHGEITTQQIVIIIVLVASFAILLFFLFRLNLGATGNKEVCHQSVVLQTTSKGIGGGLNCKTDYVCISGGEKCSDLEPTITLNVNPNSKEEIYHAMAEQMSDCWWMFGEGQLDYSQASFTTVCAICSVVKFDSKIQNNFPDGFTYREFFEYLRDTKMLTEQSYLSYLFKNNDIESLLEYLRKNNVPEAIAPGEKYVIRTGQTNTFFAGPVFEFVFGDSKRYNLFPFFTDINHMIQNPQCNYYVSKS